MLNIKRFENGNSFKACLRVLNSNLQRRLGKIVYHNTICRQLAKMNIRCYKREKTPKFTKGQAENSQKLCRKLAYLLYRSDCSVVMEDEKYLTFDESFMPENNNF